MAFTVPTLTRRELEILALVAIGCSAKEAGQRCGITDRTVQAHLDSMRLKLRAHNTTHMVAIAIASDLLPDLDLPYVARGARPSHDAAEPTDRAA